MNGSQSKSKLPILKVAALLIILICLIYSNTLKSGWYMDDYHNITRNPHVQMRSLNTDSSKNFFYAPQPNNNEKRPLAYFSFALNWWWGQDNVTGYHVVNIAIHILTAFFLFLTILLLLQTPNASGLNSNSIYFIALLSSALWAIHPIQIQAVTYIVQRMASMAALFYIIGIFCYLKARMSPSMAYRILFWGLCGLAFLMGISSKNNAIVLPVFLLLSEFVFFRDLSQKSTQKQAIAVLFCGSMVMAAAGVFLFMDGNLSFGAYKQRPFTMYQRLLTQPGIVLFYLSQIFYPIASRFSITHDVMYSTSLFTPWTTLPSIIIILLLICLAFWRIKKNPVLSFAILFFFGNHGIESTILPLEMVFEHRNYLPTLFLFVPIAIVIKKTLDYYQPIRKPMFNFLVVSLCGMMIGLGMSTYIRNWDWRSDKSLWESAMKKAPNSGRPLHGLAIGYYEATGQIDMAIDLYKKALRLKDDRIFSQAVIFNNLGTIYFSKLREYEKAVEYARNALEISSGYYEANLLLCNALGMLGRYNESIAHLDKLLLKAPNNQKYLYLKGFILLKLSKPAMAIDYFRQCLRLSPDNWKYLREIGFCLTQMHNYDRGFWFLKRSRNFHPEGPGGLLVLADNRIKAGMQDDAAGYIDQFVGTVGVENIETVLLKISENPLGLPVFFKELAVQISQNIRDRSEKYSEAAERLTQQFAIIR